jgi:hypothetical protein
LLLDTGLIEVANFGHSVKIAHHFRNLNGESKPFTGKSGWDPPDRLVDDNIKATIKTVAGIARSLPVTNNKQNLSFPERQAINKLRKNQNIIIKPADKGSATVIMSRENYIREAARQLTNTRHYRKLDNLIWPQNRHNFIEILNSLHTDKYIDKKQLKYLLGENNPQNRTFYILPKIHKPISTWLDPLTPPGRPIISDCGSESYGISEYIDYYLNTFFQSYPNCQFRKMHI